MMKRTFLALAVAMLAAPAAQAVDGTQMKTYFDANIAPSMGSEVLVSAIAAQNAMTADYSAAWIEELDQTWRAEVGTGATPTIDPVLNNAAADFLRDQVAASGGAITEVFIMDAKGLNVAASAVTSDYWQGDEAKFQETFPMGAGAVHYSEIEFDESSQTYQAQISVTLTDITGAVIGAMTVGVNADALM
jgi:hypothetical protein